jgi:hypothetical protein
LIAHFDHQPDPGFSDFDQSLSKYNKIIELKCPHSNVLFAARQKQANLDLLQENNKNYSLKNQLLGSNPQTDLLKN